MTSKIKLIVIPFAEGRSIGDRVEQEYSQLPDESWELFAHRVRRIGDLFRLGSACTKVGLAVIVQPTDRNIEWRSFMGRDWEMCDFNIKED